MPEHLPQFTQAPGDQPGHMHLRDAHHGRDLLLRQVVEEAQHQDAALPLREPPQRTHELHALGGGLDPGVPAAEHLTERGQRPLPSLQRRVERAGPCRALGADGLGHRVLGQTTGPGDLPERGRATAPRLFELPPHAPHLLPGLLHGPGQPHESGPVPEVAFQLPGDRRHRVGQKRVSVGGVVAVDGLHQAHAGHLEEVVLLLDADAAVLGGDPASHGDEGTDGSLPGRVPLAPRRVPADPSDDLVDPQGRERAVGLVLPRRAEGGQGVHVSL
ncbi:hypothetical protein GCM10010300_53010 [Streptomyces olivaceoviridis]|nr:hypothetical protein [Streptomyces olivaceoviridis]GGZ02443.1 hypothetical protein GCM10010300_53010 [Streptomyces olivaceoviridis]